MSEQENAIWQQIIQMAVDYEASDIHLTAGQRVHFRIAGELTAFSDVVLAIGFLSGQLQGLLNDMQWTQLQKERTLDFSCCLLGRRFRGNAYYQQGRLALALRLLPKRIPTLDELRVPDALCSLLAADHGLVLVCGPIGSGKTTTLAAFLDAVNHRRAAHIITLEDPLEYIFEPDCCFISQRELGRDFSSFPLALRSALREAPDIILVGEIRDQETLRTALMAASAGILVLGTLHTRNASDAVSRMEGMFPSGQQSAIRAQIADVLTAVFAQRLLPCRQGGRVCMAEVLLTEPAVRNLIRQGKYMQLESIMLSHQQDGMQTRSMAVEGLYKKGIISCETRERYRDGTAAGDRV